MMSNKEAEMEENCVLNDSDVEILNQESLSSKPSVSSIDQQLEIVRLKNEVRQLCIERDLARLERDSFKRQLDEQRLTVEIPRRRLEDDNADMPYQKEVQFLDYSLLRTSLLNVSFQRAD